MAKDHPETLYGYEPGKKEAEQKGASALSKKTPTLDVHGEKDSRFTKGNSEK